MKNKSKPSTAKRPPDAIASQLEAKDARMTLLSLMALYEIPKSTLQEIFAGAGLSSEGGYLITDASKAVIGHYKAKSETESSEEKRDKARKTKAEADTAEIKLSQEIGRLVPLEDIRRRLESFFVMLREEIRKLPWATLDQKKELCATLAKVSLPEDEAQ